MTNQDKIAAAGFPDAVVFRGPDYDDAIIGITTEGNVVYDYDKMVDHLVREYGMTVDLAADFISCDTMKRRPYAGIRAPIISRQIENIEG